MTEGVRRANGITNDLWCETGGHGKNEVLNLNNEVDSIRDGITQLAII
jgi:hypothetical protein